MCAKYACQVCNFVLPVRCVPFGICYKYINEMVNCLLPTTFNSQVSELIREQTFLKSELGLGLGELGMEAPPAEGSESAFDHGNSDSSSVCSSHTSKKAVVHSADMTGKSKPQSKKIYRACVALMPSPPARAGTGQPPDATEECVTSKTEMEQKLEKAPLGAPVEEIHRSVENDELQQVIREVRTAQLETTLQEDFVFLDKLSIG